MLKEKKSDYKWLLIWISGILCLMITACNPYIQYDEAYTLALIQHKWTDGG